MSYNKLVEKLLDFRSIAVETSDPGVLQSVDTTRDTDEPAENGDVGGRDGAEQTESPCSASPGEKETTRHDEGVSVEPSSVVGDGDEEVRVNACNANARNPSGGRAPTPTEGIVDGVNVNMDGATAAGTGTGTSTTEQPSCQAEGASDTGTARSSDENTDPESAKVAKVLKEGQVAEDFFRETASQLTYYGLSRLHQEVRARRDGAVLVDYRSSCFLLYCKLTPSLFTLLPTGSRPSAVRLFPQQPLFDFIQV